MKLKINANKIKQLRETKCWSQQQLSELTGLSLRTVQRIEAKSVASQESIKCLAAVFEISVNELFDADALTSTSSVDATTTETITQEIVKTQENDTDNERKKLEGKRQLKHAYIGFFVVFLSHMFGFYGIFTAYGEDRIDYDTFKLFKDGLSIVLICSALLFAYQARKLAKKYGIGSSF